MKTIFNVRQNAKYLIIFFFSGVCVQLFVQMVYSAEKMEMQFRNAFQTIKACEKAVIALKWKVESQSFIVPNMTAAGRSNQAPSSSLRKKNAEVIIDWPTRHFKISRHSEEIGEMKDGSEIQYSSESSIPPTVKKLIFSKS